MTKGGARKPDAVSMVVMIDSDKNTARIAGSKPISILNVVLTQAVGSGGQIISSSHSGPSGSGSAGISLGHCLAVHTGASMGRSVFALGFRDGTPCSLVSVTYR